MDFSPSSMIVLHLGCALIYIALAGLVLARRSNSRTGTWLAVACLMTAAWAGAVAWDWRSHDWQFPSGQFPSGQFPSGQPYGRGLSGWLELARSVTWYGFILHLYRQTITAHRQLSQAFTTMGLLALLVVVGLPLASVLAEQQTNLQSVTALALRLGFAVCGILLLENLYFNTAPETRWHINLLCIALGGLAVYDLMLFSDAVLFGRISFPLLEARAPVTALAAPLIALTAVRNRHWKVDIHVSRNVVFHSVTLIVSGIFLVGLAAAGELFRRRGAQWGQVIEVSLMFGGLMAVAVLVSSASIRSRIRGWLVDNFFSYRYDYRREWMRCIETLTAPEAHVSLPGRAIRAAAGVVDSPAGTLFLRAPDEVAFQWAGSWNMPALTLPIPPGHGIIPAFRDGDWIVAINDQADADDWFPGLGATWLAVPLGHLGALIGFVVLAPPRAPFALDREVYDLLRVVGREIASRVAEQRATQVLSQTRELREYSQRFAFVIHDIKNVSGQLSMLLSNAEVYADNPEFQRDMLATVRASVAKITRLLTRLQVERQERSHALVIPGDRLRDLVEQVGLTRHATVRLRDAGANVAVAMDPEAFDAVITHLLNNALEASGDGDPVEIAVRHDALSVTIDVTDLGPGMSPEFVRDALFRPFATTKDGGHGIGAYQTRELLREAGGDLLVLTEADKGTTMRILLPLMIAVTGRTDALSV